jgi:hypothetical protein
MQGRYDACLNLIKSACKQADEDYDDPFIVRVTHVRTAQCFIQF